MKKTLVIGASLNPSRYSYLAVSMLVEKGMLVVAIGHMTGIVNGVSIGTEKVSFENVHTVSLYLNPKNQVGFYNYIIELNPKRVIFNPGTENPEFYTLLRKNNIVFEEACTLVLLATNQY